MTTSSDPTSSTGPAEERVLDRFLAAREQKRAERKEQGDAYRQYLKWSGRALEIPVSVVVGLLLGRWLGGLLDHRDAGTLIGLTFGLITSIRAMVRLARAYQREEANDEPARDTDNLDDARIAGVRDDDEGGRDD